MSFACIRGGECTGCMECQSKAQTEKYIICVDCSEKIHIGDTYYQVDFDTICEDCMSNYVQECRRILRRGDF